MAIRRISFPGALTGHAVTTFVVIGGMGEGLLPTASNHSAVMNPMDARNMARASPDRQREISSRPMVQPFNTANYGDKLNILRRYADDESVNLICLDPPFNSSSSRGSIRNARDAAKRGQ
jgi:hypothetical protein